jgi:predicted kinase
MMVLIGGFPGSGKTFFARQLALRLNGLWLSSDEVRKLLKVTGKYRIDDKLHVYHQLASTTEKSLINYQKIVIVDATFSHRSMRDIFTSLAEKLSVPVLFIWVYADENLIRKRLQHPREDSEADYGVFEKIRKQFEPITIPFLSLESTNENIEQMLQKAERYIKADERR